MARLPSHFTRKLNKTDWNILYNIPRGVTLILTASREELLGGKKRLFHRENKEFQNSLGSLSHQEFLVNPKNVFSTVCIQSCKGFPQYEFTSADWYQITIGGSQSICFQLATKCFYYRVTGKWWNLYSVTLCAANTECLMKVGGRFSIILHTPYSIYRFSPTCDAAPGIEQYSDSQGLGKQQPIPPPFSALKGWRAFY